MMLLKELFLFIYSEYLQNVNFVQGGTDKFRLSVLNLHIVVYELSILKGGYETQV